MDCSWTITHRVTSLYHVGIRACRYPFAIVIINTYIPPTTSSYGPTDLVLYRAALEEAQQWIC